MIDPRKLHELRSMPADVLMDRYGSFARAAFSPEGMPVVIAARNEERDLPATLLALADSRDTLWPVVVENGSHDRTADRARKMGAYVLHSDAALKVAALQTGVSFLHEDGRASNTVLFTDADTIAGPTWAASHRRTLDDALLPSASAGNVLVWDGPNRLVDMARSVRLGAKAVNAVVRGGDTVLSGSNMAIDFARSHEAVDRYLSVDSQLFIAEEHAIVRSVTLSPHYRTNPTLAGTVVTRGDRFTTFRDIFSAARDTHHEHRAAI